MWPCARRDAKILFHLNEFGAKSHLAFHFKFKASARPRPVFRCLELSRTTSDSVINLTSLEAWIQI